MRSTDERYTPERVLAAVREFAGGQIGLDPCTTPDNRTLAWAFFDVSTDGLASPWDGSTGLVWVNPPYSRGQLRLWLRKCAREAQLGREIVALIPSDLGSQAGALAASTCDALCFVRGRLAFGSPDGQLSQGAKQPSVLVYWGDRGKAFARKFAILGVVICKS